MTTFMPASVKARAIPRPIPLSPPVMKATLPSTSFIGVGTSGHPPCTALRLAPSAAAGSARVSAAAEVPIAARAVLPRNFLRELPADVRRGFREFFDSGTGALPLTVRAILIRPRSDVKAGPQERKARPDGSCDRPRATG